MRHQYTRQLQHSSHTITVCIKRIPLPYRTIQRSINVPTTYARQLLFTAHAAMALAAVPVSSSFGMFKMSTSVLQPLHRNTSNGPLGSLAISPMAPTIWS